MKLCYTYLTATVFITLAVSGCGSEHSQTATETHPEAHEEATQERVSRFGEYRGYSERRFDEWIRQSQYVAMDDGIRLAVDVVRPAVGGNPVDEALPVVVTFSRYQRNPTGPRRYFAAQQGEEVDDTVMSNVDMDPVLQALVTHGYVVASVAVRGSGASFGRQDGVFSRRETDDTYQVIDWLANQAWSTGKIGMYGESYLGVTQYMAGSRHHPALKAIIPAVALYDLYDVFYNGGIYKSDYIKQWGDGVRALDFDIPPIPVDGDPDGKLLEKALADHATNWQPDGHFGNAPFRDDVQDEWNWTDYGVIAVIDELNSSGVAVYHTTGWYDAFIFQAPLQFLNYPGEDRILIGPWGHGDWTDAIRAERVRIGTVQHLRWFDRWLKGIDNGIEDEDRVHYAINDIPGEKWAWASSPDWPVAGTEDVVLYLDETRSNSVASLNDGSLVFSPAEAEAEASFAVNVTTTTGTNSRWDNCTGPDLDYPDMTANDEKSLTFTTAPLERDMTVVGYPMVNLQARSSKPDGDFHVLVEEIDAEGYSWLVTEGQLRLSMRKTDPAHKASWHDHFWRRQLHEDVLPVEPGQWYAVDIDLLPTAYLFNQGNRIRVSIMGADKDNTEHPEYEDALLGVKLGGFAGSRISLPILKAN